MKRNELFKKLMNVQSQVTSLMNAVLNEEGAPVPNEQAANSVAGALIGSKNVEAVKKYAVEKAKEAMKFGNDVKSVVQKQIDEAVDMWNRGIDLAAVGNSGRKEILDIAKKASPETVKKVIELSNRLGGDVNNQDFKSLCKYVGIASIALGCIFGYLLFPSAKNGLIAAFNSGSPDLERLGGMLKAVASSTLVVGFIVFGSILVYHGFTYSGIDADKNPLIGSLLQGMNNMSKAIKNRFQSPIKPVEDKAWQW
jgi:hypothetical protein